MKNEKYLEKAIECLDNILISNDQTWESKEEKGKYQSVRDWLIELKFRRELTGQRVCKYQMMNKDYPNDSVLCLYTSEPCTMCIFKDSGTYKKAEAESDGV